MGSREPDPDQLGIPQGKSGIAHRLRPILDIVPRAMKSRQGNPTKPGGSEPDGATDARLNQLLARLGELSPEQRSGLVEILEALLKIQSYLSAQAPSKRQPKPRKY
jgi:hypothetical protein